MRRPNQNTSLRVRRIAVLAALAIPLSILANCTYYRDPRARVIVTSDRDNATVYLVPADATLAAPPTRAALRRYIIDTTSSKRGTWVRRGSCWLILEKAGAWSSPVEFEVRLDYLNKAHVGF